MEETSQIFTMEEFLRQSVSSASSSTLPEESKKKRGRPRKVAIQGEELRRKQMRVKDKDGHFPVIKNKRFARDIVNTSTLYLPEGWKCFATRRAAGIHKGLFDLIYVTPAGERIRSRNDVIKWVMEKKSSIDPLKFLFTRTLEVLLAEGNAKNIIFRTASRKGKVKRAFIPAKSCNTIFTEGAKELLETDETPDDDDNEYNSSLSLFSSLNTPQLDFQEDLEEREETPINDAQTLDTPKIAKKPRKSRKVPLEKRLECLKSPYFALKSAIPTKPVSIHAIHDDKWIPPRSPYNLIQEDLYHDPWQLLIATIFLNCTSGKLAIPVIHEFLARWPTPHEACSASLYDVVEVVNLLGLGRTRAGTILRFSHEYLTVDWKTPNELFGIGKYGNDSYKVFCLGLWKSLESDDKYLNLYVNWMLNSQPFGRTSDLSRFPKGCAKVPK